MTLPATIRVCLAAALLAAAGRADIIDRIAVSVGNRVITARDLDREIRVSAFLNGTKPDFSPAAKRATAGRLVDQKLIQNELEASRYPTPAASEVQPQLDAFSKKYFPGDDDYRRARGEAGITERDVVNELLWQRTLLLFIEVRFRPGVQVTDQEIQDYFEKVVAPAAKAAGQTPTLEQYRAQIEQKLSGERVDQELDRWLQGVHTRTEIVYHDEVFSSGGGFDPAALFPGGPRDSRRPPRTERAPVESRPAETCA